MLSLEATLVAGWLAAAGGSLILASLLLLLDSVYHQRYLGSWASSWLASMAYHLLAAGWVLLEVQPGADPRVFPALAGLALIAGLIQASMLSIGTYEILFDRRPPRRLMAASTLVPLGVGMAGAWVLLTYRDALGFLAPEGGRSLAVALAALTAAAVMLRTPLVAPSRGRSLVSTGLLAFGLVQGMRFALVAAGLGPENAWQLGIILGLVDFLVQLVLGLGLVAWFLEKERDRVLSSAKEIERLALQDHLTRLPNRKRFLSQLDQILSRRRSSDSVAILFLDLDRFKVINDTLGHAYGDEVLVQVAERLRAAVGDSGTVARFGGDQFTVVFPALARQGDVARTAKRLLDLLLEAHDLHGHQIFVGASIGTSVAPRDGRDSETLLKNAEMAMYQAKESGHGKVRAYSPILGARALERLSLESDLHFAFERQELVLYYQPILDLAKGRFSGVEALIRWQHPWKGLIGPADFINLADLVGLSDKIDLWVLETACEQVRAWESAGLDDLDIAVNLSARPFQAPQLVERVLGVLEATGLAPRRLELEITETLAMHNAEVTQVALEGLRKLGVQVSIDDFGVGYSSLSYLKNFPINTVKIDRSFVHDLKEGRGDAAIAGAVIALAHSLKLGVVAEGVEEEPQLRFLEQHRCDRVQGFLVSQPLPAEECLERLLEGPDAALAPDLDDTLPSTSAQAS